MNFIVVGSMASDSSMVNVVKLDRTDIFRKCCHITDHIRLPIIHTKTYINIEQRQETRTDRIKQIILLQ